MIKAMIKFESVVEFIDTNIFRILRLKAHNKETTTTPILPYGLSSNCPNGGLAVSFQIACNESNKVSFVDFPQKRPQGLKTGEVILSNYLTGSFSKFQENGDILSQTGTSKVLMQSDGLASMSNDFATISIQGDGTCFIGNQNGGITILPDGSIQFSSPSATHNGVNVGNTHIHTQGNDSDGNIEQPTSVPQ